MKVREIRSLRSKHEKNLTLSCDEYHGHGVGCLVGPKDSISIVKLASSLLYLKERIKKFAKKESK